MTARTLDFFDKYDLLLMPATIVPPFPVENRYVAECAGKKFDNYIQWLDIVDAITLVVLPGAVAALRLHRLGPSGRPADGRPAARRSASSLPAPRCWKTFWACAARRRSSRGRRSNASQEPAVCPWASDCILREPGAPRPLRAFGGGGTVHGRTPGCEIALGDQK
jgi:hypothetical protein